VIRPLRSKKEYSEEKVESEQHARRTLLSDFILGSQDGLVNVLGIILGMSAATQNTRLIFVATLAALGAESVSMGAVAYTSTASRRRLYLREVEREKREMRDIPDQERHEVLQILKGWGYKGEELEEMMRRIATNPKAMLELMMSYELELAPVGQNEARRSFLTVLASTLVGSSIPIIPLMFVGGNVIAGAVGSVVISGAALFLIGWFGAKATVGSLWKNGLQLAAIGLAAGFAGFLIGYLLGAAPGV
jgi:VIT1/CCC1 family predicted Fe2+/Mn2+ transporter